jgi:hypothetical protein
MKDEVVITKYRRDRLGLSVARHVDNSNATYHIESVDWSDGRDWNPLLMGMRGREFWTSFGAADADVFQVTVQSNGHLELKLSCQSQGAWYAEESLILSPTSPWLIREQTYFIQERIRGALHPGWRLPDLPGCRYTLPLYCYEAGLGDLPAFRADVEWALPFPFHVWHSKDWLAIYGLDKKVSPGTLDLLPVDDDGFATVRVYYPDKALHKPIAEQVCESIDQPGATEFVSKSKVSLTEVIAVIPLGRGHEPLMEAERLAADLLLSEPRPSTNLSVAADRFAEYFRHCGLWNPDALGPGRGWFHNMWVNTHPEGCVEEPVTSLTSWVEQPESEAPTREWPSACFDLGWGEGIAAETIAGLRRHWQRTGRTDLLFYIDEMTRNIERFKRGPGKDEPYFDRTDGQSFGDFLIAHAPDLLPKQGRIWTHSLGHMGYQLITSFLESPEYPNQKTRERWLEAAGNIARFLAKIQDDTGDLPDIIDHQNSEVNQKPHRIAARLVAAGLWTKFSKAMGDRTWIERAHRLLEAVGPEIERYEYYNQMIDAFSRADCETTDGEAAYYVLEGLAPLYEVTQDSYVLALCKKAVAYGVSWTYFYDLPRAYRGIARGGQCCRMPDLPLIYPVGPAKAVEPLLILYRATGDAFYERLASEMVFFISQYQHDNPDKPWDGGAVHAVDQRAGCFWGPNLAGQVDSGISSGNSLAALELWLKQAPNPPNNPRDLRSLA